jgi:pimeloyl-ACP methyl ester carboxylesterase
MPVSGDLYYSLHCEKGPDTLPVILIHGAGGTRLYWPPEIRRLPGYCVYALDLPGHGKSSFSDGHQTVGEYTDILYQWLEAVHLRRAVLVGHSMGGAIALSMALHHPERVIALGLISSGARLKVNPSLLAYAIDRTTFMKAAELLVSFSFSPRTPKRLVELASKRMLETRQSVFSGDLQACNKFDIMNRVAEVAQPTLVVCGADDEMTPLRYAQFLANGMPNARLAVVPDAGHMVMLEQPRAVADHMINFLQGVLFRPGEGF